MKEFKRFKKKLILIILLNCFISFCYAQSHSHSHESPTKLMYPDIMGYKTLKADLHIHTVFSDGNVWPTVRVEEALRENLDVISLTDHLEYQPHKDDIPHPDRNRGYEIAINEAKKHNLIVVPGSEITRTKPVGHNNAIFISDANALLQKDANDVFAEAKKQDAFVFWNHPYWLRQSPNGLPIWSESQKERIKNKELHGIEVINGNDYSEESLKLALEHNLTIMGTSDIHGLIDWDYTQKGKHRPITLVFAKEKTVAGFKEALFAGRTVAVSSSVLVGKEEFLIPLLKNCLEIANVKYLQKTNVLEVELKNISSNDLLFENQMKYTFYNSGSVFEIKAGESKTIQIKTLERLANLDFKLKALQAYTAPKKQAMVTWKIAIE